MKCFWPSFKILNGLRGLCYMCCKFIVVYCVMIYIGFMLNFTDFAAGSRRCSVQHCCPMTSLKPEDAFDPNQVKWWWIVVVMRFNFLGQWFHIKIEYIHSYVLGVLCYYLILYYFFGLVLARSIQNFHICFILDFKCCIFIFISQKHKSKGRTFLFIVVTKLCYSCFVHPVKLLLLFYSWARDISRPSTYFVQLEEYLGQQKVLENVYKMKVQQTSFTMPFAYSDPW